MEVDLRSVEGTIPFIYHIVKSKVIQSAPQSLCCHLPVLIASHGVLRACGQLHMVFESEQAVNLVNEAGNTLDLIPDLVRCHENVGIVLCKTAHTHESVKLA